MNTRIAIVAALIAATSAFSVEAASERAPSEAQAKQQSRMARCNQEAAGQKGAERKAFMKQCLSGASSRKR